MIEQAIYNLLSTSTIIAAVVGTHVYQGQRPADQPLPAIVITRGSGNPEHHLKGALGPVTGFVRVTCLAATYLDAGLLAWKVRSRLDGQTSNQVIDGEPVRVGHLKLESGPSDLPSDHRDGQGLIKTHAVQMDFRYLIHLPLPKGQ